jgi:hypothetical protein
MRQTGVGKILEHGGGGRRSGMAGHACGGKKNGDAIGSSKPITLTTCKEAVVTQSKNLNKKPPLDKLTLNGKKISTFIHLQVVIKYLQGQTPHYNKVFTGTDPALHMEPFPTNP